MQSASTCYVNNIILFIFTFILHCIGVLTIIHLNEIAQGLLKDVDFLEVFILFYKNDKKYIYMVF